MPELSNFISLLPPMHHFSVLALAALAGGLVRGFTGFGFAMIFMPIAASVVSPGLALAIIFLIDVPFALFLGARAAPKADMPSVGTLLIAASLMLPVGLWLLTDLNPVLTRWIICAVILLALAALVSGWRYRGRPGVPLTLGVGAMSGLFSGLAGLGGMPLAIFWLSSQTKSPQEMRHDLQTFFGLATIVSTFVIGWKGLFTPQALGAALVLMPVYGVALAIGTAGFHRASEATFRKVAYVIILMAAILGLPLLDGMLR